MNSRPDCFLKVRFCILLPQRNICEIVHLVWCNLKAPPIEDIMRSADKYAKKWEELTYFHSPTNFYVLVETEQLSQARYRLVSENTAKKKRSCF